MAVYMVERDLRGISFDDLGNAQRAAIAQADQMSSGGARISYVRSTFAPEDGRCMCLFQADDPATVKRLNDDARLPYSRIIEVFDLRP
jgi:hypothetical protein